MAKLAVISILLVGYTVAKTLKIVWRRFRRRLAEGDADGEELAINENDATDELENAENSVTTHVPNSNHSSFTSSGSESTTASSVSTNPYLNSSNLFNLPPPMTNSSTPITNDSTLSKPDHTMPLRRNPRRAVAIAAASRNATTPKIVLKQGEILEQIDQVLVNLNHDHP
jgi:hypothetical protein